MEEEKLKDNEKDIEESKRGQTKMTLEEFCGMQDGSCDIEIQSIYDYSTINFEKGRSAEVRSFNIDYDSWSDESLLTIKVADKKLYIDRLNEEKRLLDVRIREIEEG